MVRGAACKKSEMRDRNGRWGVGTKGGARGSGARIVQEGGDNGNAVSFFSVTRGFLRILRLVLGS